MKILDPEEASGVVQKLRDSVDEALRLEREKILVQFSLMTNRVPSPARGGTRHEQ
jgi:hypothetical protein